MSIRLNDGLGNFSGTEAVIVGETPRAIAAGDLDGDGTLDFVTTSAPTGTGGSASVRLNKLVLATAPKQLAEQVSLYPNPAHESVRLHLPVALARQGVQLTLLNTLGQVVMKQNLAPQSTAEMLLPQLGEHTPKRRSRQL